MAKTANPPRSIARTVKGPVRAENQDAVLADDELGLWLVADGMGGHACGAEASRLAREVIHAEVAGGAGTRKAIEAAHRRIIEAQQADPACMGMGTTVVVLRDQDGAASVCWVGDSRAYRFRRASGELEQISRDHNLAGVLAAEGRISSGEARMHPQRHVLTECLGQARPELPVIECEQVSWEPGDWVLLCSDGLSGELTDEGIARLLGADSDLAAAADALVNAAIEAGGRDNVSVVLIQAPD